MFEVDRGEKLAGREDWKPGRKVESGEKEGKEGRFKAARFETASVDLCLR